MAEYIERGGKLFPTPFSSEEHGDYRQGWNHCLRAIYQMPAADVKPVVRSHWYIDEGCDYCANCKNNFPRGIERAYRFCPMCGADMREDDNG